MPRIRFRTPKPPARKPAALLGHTPKPPPGPVTGEASHDHGPRPRRVKQIDELADDLFTAPLHRGAGYATAALPVLYGASGYAAGRANRGKLERQNTVMRRQVAKASAGAARKTFRGSYKVYDSHKAPLRERPGNVAQALGRVVMDGIDSGHPAVPAALATTTYGALAVGANRGAGQPGKENRQLRRQVRAKQRGQAVIKFAPSKAGAAVLRNRHNLIAPALGAGAAGAVAEHEHKGGGRTTAAGGAAALGYGGFKATGVRIRNAGRAVENTPPEGMSNSKRKKLRDEHYKSFGLHPNQPDIKQALEKNPHVYRTWPSELLDSKHKRRLGHMSGAKGKAMEAASIALPAAAVLATGHRKVEKASRQYGYLETKRSLPRTAEFAAGAGLAAWGGSRLHLGSAAASGVRFAESKGHGPGARAAVDIAREARNTTRTATGHGAAWLNNRIPGMGSALEPIPSKLRPHAAVVGGTALTLNAMPTRRRKFVPYGGQA